MNKDLLLSLVSLGILVCLVVVVAALNAYSCQARWADSGMNSSYKPFAGCRVQLPNGRWVPSTVIRETDVQQK